MVLWLVFSLKFWLHKLLRKSNCNLYPVDRDEPGRFVKPSSQCPGIEPRWIPVWTLIYNHALNMASDVESTSTGLQRSYTVAPLYQHSPASTVPNL